MNIGMFIVGAIIFSIYVFFLIWNIFDSAKKNKRDNYPTVHDLLKNENVEVMVGHYPHNFKKRKSRRSDKRKDKVIK